MNKQLEELLADAKKYADYNLYFALNDVRQFIRRAFELGFNSGSNQSEDDGK